jgi:2-polyprenyl-3-methyl-5-hydroxy-6-metoxy-1,4-benzoquinol methylase
MGKEFQYNYTKLDQTNHKYAAFLYLDMVEYSQLPEVLAMSHKLINLLAPDGVLIIQTPNCICVRSPLISDITNLHCDNIPDVWAYLTSMD